MQSTSTLTATNRSDPTFAAALFEKLCPSTADRLLVLHQLVKSIRLAELASTSAWTLTLNYTGFQLNVGAVEAMTFNVVTSVKDQYVLLELRLLIHGPINKESQTYMDADKHIHAVFPSNYISVPQPQAVYVGLGDLEDGALPKENHHQLGGALQFFHPLHASFIAKAALTSTGKIRKKSSFLSSHSEGLYIYAKTFVEQELKLVDAVNSVDLPALLSPPAGELQPRRLQSTPSTTFARNPAVIAWVLQRSKGACECCAKPAPFVNSNDEPHLEVHHVKQLSDNGSDRVSNAVALCPNCHREMHLGKNKSQLRLHLLGRIAELVPE
jgi:HNH endonuclease